MVRAVCRRARRVNERETEKIEMSTLSPSSLTTSVTMSPPSSLSPAPLSAGSQSSPAILELHGEEPVAFRTRLVSRKMLRF